MKGVLERNESKKSYLILREMKRVSSLIDPSHSTWVEFFFLKVDSMDIFGQASLGMFLGKYGNASLLEACVR
jgi:hypothetical protein